MKKIFIFLLILGGLVYFSPTPRASALIANWQKSVNVQPTSPTDFQSATFDQSVSRAISDGANYITLIIPVTQSSLYSTNVTAAYNTPSDQSLASAVAYIHAHGASVAFSLHDDPANGAWRAFINPSNRTAWFQSYGGWLNHYAVLGQQLGIQQIVIGTEMSDMTLPSVNSTNTANWLAMIAQMRQEFSGSLTYSAQHDGYMADDQSLGFWPALNYIGISAYYSLSGSNNSVAGIQSKWSQWYADIHNLSVKYNKPVLFTEIGYVSTNNSLIDPGAAKAYGGAVNDTIQANAYQALFQYWNNYSFMHGVALWAWNSNPYYGGPSSTGYTPQNKPAEQVMKKFFTANSASSNTTPLTNSNPTTSSSTITTPTTINLNIAPPAKITYSATANGSKNVMSGNNSSWQMKATASPAVTNAIVDFEVYNSSGQRVYQKFYTNQSLSSLGDVTNYSLNVTTSGQYTVKLGIFNSNWQTLYWNNSAATFTVQALTPPSTTPVNTTPSNTTPPTTSSTSSPTSSPSTSTSTSPSTTTPSTDNNSTSPTTTTNNLNTNTTNTSSTTPSSSTTNTTSSATPSTSTPAVGSPITIWWPAGNTSVSGLQPFKALINGVDQSSYKMYWQVDNGQLNAMHTNSAPVNHKEAEVDLSGWNWNSNGMYTVNFVAKDLNGNIISEKSVVIHVVN